MSFPGGFTRDQLADLMLEHYPAEHDLAIEHLQVGDTENLHLAARHGHTGVVSLLLNAGMSLQSYNQANWSTPLLEAVKSETGASAMQLNSSH